MTAKTKRVRLILLGMVLAAFALRVWGLGTKGLSYDEAASALMARATPLEIVQFHWQAAFEHPPFWQLLLWGWSAAAGQSEFALRFLPTLAGVLLVPLIFALARRLTLPFGPPPLALVPLLVPLLSALFVATMPVLVLYSQEARMYTIVVACALASMILLLDFTSTSPRPSPEGEGEKRTSSQASPEGQREKRTSSQASPLEREKGARSSGEGWGAVIAFVLINWLMLGLHYYSALLLVAQGVWLLWAWIKPPAGSNRVGWAPFVALVVAGLPLLGWLAFAPGFRATAEVVLGGSDAQPSVPAFLGELWRGLSFGAFRWQPEYAWVGWLLLPIVVVGVAQVVIAAWQGSGGARLVLLAVLLPVALSALVYRSLAARYILFVAPLLGILAAMGIAWLWSLRRWLGWAALALALGVATSGLYYYFADFEKSEYREMAAYLKQVASGDDAFVLEAPRQHLLAKYYFPDTWSFATAPNIALPEFWPVNAPPVVPEEMDDLLQSLLRERSDLWLILTSEDEVDKGEFVQKYLTAISYRMGCQAWLDVRLCHFVDPGSVPTGEARTWDVTFGDELTLTGSRLSEVEGDDGAPVALLQLDWRAEVQPTVDYRVSVRLLDDAGNVLAQQDDYPIGDLLPPTTWQAGDEKPGYVAVGVPEGTDSVVVGVYEPESGAMVGDWVVIQ